MNATEKTIVATLLILALAVVAVRSQSSPPPFISAAALEDEERSETPYTRPVATSLPPASRAQRFGAQGPDVSISVAPLYEENADDEQQSDVIEGEEEPLYDDTPMVPLEDALAYLGEQLDGPNVDVPWDTEGMAGPWSMSDQELVDQMISLLDPEQRVAFAELWSNMSASERRAWLAQMRVSLSG